MQNDIKFKDDVKAFVKEILSLETMDESTEGLHALKLAEDLNKYLEPPVVKVGRALKLLDGGMGNGEDVVRAIEYLVSAQAEMSMQKTISETTYQNVLKLRHSLDTETAASLQSWLIKINAIVLDLTGANQ